jgi:adenylate cyclase
MRGFIHKLSQRGVIKVAIAYLVISWLIMQLADVTFPLLRLPDWTVTLVLVLLIVGFPIAMVLAWAYEMTPDGIQREPGDPVARPEPETPDTATATDEKSIAVLPFANMSADKEQEHFCDGLTEELLNVLANLPDLRVASRTSCFAYKDKTIDLPAIAAKLHVAHILEGSVRKSGTSIRITAQLIEVATDSHLWSETYDRQLDDIFAIQDDIARRILNALKLKLGAEQASYPTTRDSQAYEYFLRGRGYASSKGSKDQDLAIKLFQKAVALDPEFVRAWIKLAQSSANYAMYSKGGKLCQKIAAEAAEKATDLAPDYAESHMANGYAFLASKQYAAAEAEFFEAIERDPKLSIAYHYLARSAYHQGQLDKALKYFNKSTDLNSDDYESPILAVPIYEKFHDQDNVLRMAKIGVERVKRYLEDYPNNQRAYYLGVGGLTKLGEIELAKKWAERAYQIAPDDVATRYNLACFYANIGNPEKALDFLENSISSRTWIENDPDLESLHGHPRFQAVLDALST